MPNNWKKHKLQRLFASKRSKHLIYGFSLILIHSFVQANPKTDSLPNNPQSSTTILEIKDADKIFKLPDHDWWDKYSNAIIAFFTVIGSAYISYKIASKQTSLAKEQLEVTKKQMEENYRVAIAQVKANNISAARIEWIQKLRPLLAAIISTSSKYSEMLEDYDGLIKKTKNTPLTKEEQEKKIKLLDDGLKLLEQFEIELNQIKLFLNLEEKKHADLVDAFDTYLNNQFKKSKGESIVKEIDEEDLIDKSRAVLKEAWEQAKNIS